MHLLPSSLVNKSVSCWLNAIIQAFGSCPSFCDALVNDLTENLENPLFEKFADYVITNHRGLDTSACSGRILDALNKLTRDSGRNSKLTQQQQCALEFYDLILSGLCHEGIFKMFRSYYVREVTCPSCSHVAQSKDAVQHVDIIKNSNIPTYHDTTHPRLLRDYLGHRETLSAWECPSCHTEFHDIDMIYRLCHPAKIIVFMFNKVTDNSAVTLPPEMCIKARGGDDRLTYKPVAVINHYGTPESGHYITNCLRMSPRGALEWYRCNDDIVTSATSDPLSGSAIYMAFYALDE